MTYTASAPLQPTLFPLALAGQPFALPGHGLLGAPLFTVTAPLSSSAPAPAPAPLIFPKHVTISSLAEQIGATRATVIHFAELLGFAFIKRPFGPRRKYLASLTGTQAGAIAQAHLQQFAFFPLAPAPAPSRSDFGVIYLLQLEPEHDPGRFKLGFTTNLEQRLEDLRTAAPYAICVATWPAHRSWERMAIVSLARSATLIRTEVFRATDLTQIIQAGHHFFAIMPPAPSPTADDIPDTPPQPAENTRPAPTPFTTPSPLADLPPKSGHPPQSPPQNTSPPPPLQPAAPHHPLAKEPGHAHPPMGPIRPIGPLGPIQFPPLPPTTSSPPVNPPALALTQSLLSAESPADCHTALRTALNAYDALNQQTIAETGANLACRAGCSLCCSLRVDVFAHEVLLLAHHIRTHFTPAQIEQLMQRLAAHSAKILPLTPFEHATQNHACPLLVESRCSVYEARPMNCRRHHSLQLSACEHAFAHPADLEFPAAHHRQLYTTLTQALQETADVYASLRLDTTVYELGTALEEALTDEASWTAWKDHLEAFVRASITPTAPPRSGGSG